MMDEKTQFIEIYKSQVQLICSISDRQAVMNRHYILVISALVLAFYTLLINMSKLESITIIPITPELLVICCSVSGICISLSWFESISYYTYLVSCKHDSLKKLERRLEYQFFDDEWGHLGENKKPRVYLKLSTHKLFIPFISWGVFTLLLWFGYKSSAGIPWEFFSVPVGTFILMVYRWIFVHKVRSTNRGNSIFAFIPRVYRWLVHKVRSTNRGNSEGENNE